MNSRHKYFGGENKENCFMQQIDVAIYICSTISLISNQIRNFDYNFKVIKQF